VQQNELQAAKVEATWDITDPIFSARERAALEMATIFTLDYHSFEDAQFEEWQRHFSDEEMAELATFFAVADGFGKAVEMLGLGAVGRDCD